MSDSSCKEEDGDFPIAAFNPAGDSVVLGGLNKFVVFGYRFASKKWEEISNRKVLSDNLFLSIMSFITDQESRCLSALCALTLVTNIAVWLKQIRTAMFARELSNWHIFEHVALLHKMQLNLKLRLRYYLKGWFLTLVCLKVENTLITSILWKPDGGKLLLGTLTGSVDAFDICIRRNCYKDKFEFTYVSRSSVSEFVHTCTIDMGTRSQLTLWTCLICVVSISVLRVRSVWFAA